MFVGMAVLVDARPAFAAEAVPAPVAVALHEGVLTATFAEAADDAALRAAVPGLIARGVEAVILRKGPIRDIQPLAAMTGLRSLQLSGTQVRDLGPLAGLTALRSLNLQFAPVSDFAPLSGLANLRVLNASGTEIQDLSPLAGLQGLRDLSLSVTKVRDLSPLASLHELESLNLNSTRVSDLRPLAGLRALSTLSLNGTSVGDLQPIAGALKLKRLDAGGTRVADVRPLSNLRELQVLNLEGTKVSDIGALSGLTSLRSLLLAGSLAPVPPPRPVRDVTGSKVEPTAPVAEDPVLYWNDRTNRTIQAEAANPFLASRVLALESIAVLDTIRSIAGGPAYLVRLSPPQGISMAVAVSGAAHTILTRVFPDRRRVLDAALADALAGTPESPERARALAFGKAIAEGALAARDADGATRAPVVARPSGIPARWSPTPPDFLPPAETQWATLRPFALISQSQFRPSGPPALDSAAFADARAAVASLGAARSTSRTEDQTQIALFWADVNGTFTPAGHWNAIAAGIAGPLRRGLAIEAEMFAELNVALADTAIAVADAKYSFWFWRPITAIRTGHGTERPIPDWAPLIETPNHPGYVSGHAAFSGAAAAVLNAWFGTQAFETSSPGLPGVTRSFASVQHAAEEAARSRVYAGIHFGFDNNDGLALGRAVGGWTLAAFQRAPEERGPTIMLDPPVLAGRPPASAVTGCALSNIAPVSTVTVALRNGAVFSVPVNEHGVFSIPAASLTPPGRHLVTLSAASATGRAGVLRLEVETSGSGDAVGPPIIVQ